MSVWKNSSYLRIKGWWWCLIWLTPHCFGRIICNFFIVFVEIRRLKLAVSFRIIIIHKSNPQNKSSDFRTHGHGGLHGPRIWWLWVTLLSSEIFWYPPTSLLSSSFSNSHFTFVIEIDTSKPKGFNYMFKHLSWNLSQKKEKKNIWSPQKIKKDKNFNPTQQVWDLEFKEEDGSNLIFQWSQQVVGMRSWLDNELINLLLNFSTTKSDLYFRIWIPLTCSRASSRSKHLP